MSKFVESTIVASDFRQNYATEPEPAPVYMSSDVRHWMLDFGAGRDLLKAALRKSEPDLYVAYFKAAPELDEKLDAMIDVLGMRDVAEPLPSEKLAATCRLFVAMLRTMFKK